MGEGSARLKPLHSNTQQSFARKQLEKDGRAISSDSVLNHQLPFSGHGSWIFRMRLSANAVREFQNIAQSRRDIGG